MLTILIGLLDKDNTSEDTEKLIDNLRVQRLLGINRMDGKATLATIPNEGKDRSMFSMERWAFFLDAPFEISNKCCYFVKKEPMKRYQKETKRMPITAQTADESRLRLQVWLKQGCNAFDAKKPISNPMSFWKEQDVLQYIYENNLPIAPVYGDVVIDYEGMAQIGGQVMWSEIDKDFQYKPLYKTTGAKRTGCMLCGYGAHMRNDDRFLMLKETHPKVCKALDVCQNNGVTYREAIDWINEHNGKGKLIDY